MKTYQVPVFIGVVADSAEDAKELAMNFMEYALEVGNDDETFAYCDVGRLDEVVEQL